MMVMMSVVAMMLGVANDLAAILSLGFKLNRSMRDTVLVQLLLDLPF